MILIGTLKWPSRIPLPCRIDSLTVQNRLPGDIRSEKTYQHVHNRPYGDFRFFGLQLGLDHHFGCVQSRLRLNPSLTPFSCFKCCKSDKNRFFSFSHRPQTINNVKKRPKDFFCVILSNLSKVDFFPGRDRKIYVPIFTVFSQFFRGESSNLE